MALADCNKALALRPNYTYARGSRALVHLRMGNYPAAIDDASAAIVIDPADADALFLRGLAERKSGRTADGKSDIARAKKLDPKIIDTYAGYGVAL